MSKIKLTGSNSGYVEISSAADAGNLTLALPTSGTALLSNADNVFSGITTFTGLNITDDVTFNGGSYDVLWDASDNQLEFGDNAKLSFGASSDLQLYHNGTDTQIQNITGGLYIGNIAGNSNHVYISTRNNFVVQTNLNESAIQCFANGGVELFYNSSLKLNTTNTGAIVTGICTATSFSGSSVGLTYDSPLSHRNFLINGSTIVWQRGTVNPNVSNYGCDRWWFANNATRVDRSTTTPDGFAYSMKVTSSGGTTSIGQAIELTDTGRSQFEPFTKPYTLSFYARTDSGTNDISANVYYRNSKFSTTNQTNWNGSAGNNSFWNMGTMTTTWQRFSKTFTTGGNPNANNQILAIEFNNSATYYITGIQFEKGAAATPFEHRSFAEELSRCQRYFYRVSAAASGTGSYKHLGTMQYYSGNNPYGKMLDLPVPMRTIPTGSFTGDIRPWTSGGSSNGSFTTINFDRNDNLFLGSNGSTTNQNSGSAGNATPITLWPSSSMTADAEL